MNRIIHKDANVTVFQSALFQTNSTVVKTEDLILIIDPAWLHEEVMEIKHYVDAIKGDLPIFLIFTHSDYDHIIGYKAFNPTKVFASEGFVNNPDKGAIIEQIHQFDEQYYIKRSYPIVYPSVDFVVFNDGFQYRVGNTRMAFYLTPGHTACSMMLVIWQIGLCLAGDYLSDIEFPFIYHSSVDYEDTLARMPDIHDKSFFTRLVPGHGNITYQLEDWLKRRTEGLAYIYALRESIATGVEFDESSLWTRYHFPRLQSPFHKANLALMRQEYEHGLWTWTHEMVTEIRKEEDESPHTQMEDGG